MSSCKVSTHPCIKNKRNVCRKLIKFNLPSQKKCVFGLGGELVGDVLSGSWVPRSTKTAAGTLSI